MCKPIICYWQDPHIQEYKFQKRSNFHMQELLKRTCNSKSIFNWVQWSRTFKIEYEPRSAIPKCTARTGWYIPVRQVTCTRTAATVLQCYNTILYLLLQYEKKIKIVWYTLMYHPVHRYYTILSPGRNVGTVR